MNIRNRLFLVLIAIFMVILLGSVGYFSLYRGRYDMIDCVYMTIISLTGVGYGEVLQVTGNPAAQIFTMILIPFGMGVILYGISALTALMIEGELSGILRKNRMRKRIAKLKSHYIVCGGGETGRPVMEEILKNRETAVLIEKDPEKISRVNHPELLFVEGDATDDENLITAGIEHAAGIMICLPSDKDNLYITMTARILNSEIRIVSRMTDPKLEVKLKKAGADRVVSPNIIGALRMASEMIRPTAVDFLDNMLRSSQGTLRISQLPISRGSGFCGKTIVESGIKNKFGLLILGAKTKDQEITFNPAPATILENGMTLVVMGEVEKIRKACENL